MNVCAIGPPAPVPKHQRTCRGLFRILDAACPSDLEVFFAPLENRPDVHTSVQPDLVVVRWQRSAKRTSPLHRYSLSKCCRRPRAVRTSR